MTASPERWNGALANGPGLTFATAFNGSDLNSLPNGSGVLSSVSDITNGTYLDVFWAISISLGSITIAAPAFIGIYFYPLNQDGTTYGDGYFSSGSQVAKTPSASYWLGNIIVGTTGAAVATGTIDRLIVPPRSGRFLAFNQLGATLASSSNVAKMESYLRAIG